MLDTYRLRPNSQSETLEISSYLAGPVGDGRFDLLVGLPGNSGCARGIGDAGMGSESGRGRGELPIVLGPVSGDLYVERGGGAFDAGGGDRVGGGGFLLLFGDREEPVGIGESSVS